MYDLNNLIPTNSGWVLQQAAAINDVGQIIGIGITNGQSHGFLLVTSQPIIIRQPVGSQTVAIGSTVSLSVRANGSLEPISYQWYFGTNAIAGATNATLTLANIQQSQSGTYTVVLSNMEGTATSSPAVLSVLPSLDIHMVPDITIYGTVGFTYELQYLNALGPTKCMAVACKHHPDQQPAGILRCVGHWPANEVLPTPANQSLMFAVSRRRSECFAVFYWI